MLGASAFGHRGARSLVAGSRAVLSAAELATVLVILLLPVTAKTDWRASLTVQVSTSRIAHVLVEEGEEN